MQIKTIPFHSTTDKRKTLYAIASVLFAITTFTACAQSPSLMITAEEIHERAKVAQREPWAKADLANLMKEADDFPASYEKTFGLTSVELPPEGGQWLHWYVCPDTGTKLEFHPPNHNVCPDTGKEYPGYPFDKVVYQLRNDALHKAALTLGLAYRFSGNLKYATQAASLLKAYADAYANWPLHDNNGKPTPNGARAYSQTLDESIWLINLAWTYDLVRGSGALTSADKQHIENDLLRPSSQTVSKAHKEPTDNIQAWINGAVAAVGYTLHDPALIHEALDGPIGFRYQMHHFIQEGFWTEGAWGYQFYAMRALVMTAQMATMAGTNLWKEEPALLSLFQAPLGVVFPNGLLPAFNDSGATRLYEQDFLYERAYAAAPNPDLLRVIEPNGRKNLDALLFGVEHLPSAPTARLASSIFPEAGFATLRNPKTDLTIITKFGSHGGPHGHYDKLGFILYSQGRILGIDPGTQLYGLPLHREWDSMTVAHNTVSVDELRQAAATGKLLDWQTGPDYTSVTMDAGPVYPSADLKRTILLTPDYSLTLDDDASLDGKPHIFDWTYHNLGSTTVVAPATLQPSPAFPNQNGYGHLLNPMTATTAANIQVQFNATGDGHLHKAGQLTDALPTPATLHLTIAGAPATEFFTGTAPGPDLRVPIPFVLLRRNGVAASFLALFAPPEPAQPGEITLERQPSGTIVVLGPHFRDTIQDIIQPGGKLTYHREIR